MVMKRKAFDNWINFLKENPDRQIKGTCSDDRGGCCVMGSLYVSNGIKPTQVSPEGFSGHPAYDTAANRAILGSTYVDVNKACMPAMVKLSDMNNAGKTFAELIPIIEEFVEVEPKTATPALSPSKLESINVR